MLPRSVLSCTSLSVADDDATFHENGTLAKTLAMMQTSNRVHTHSNMLKKLNLFLNEAVNCRAPSK